MSKFILLTESILEKKRQQEMVLSMVKHCAIPELPSPDTTAFSHLPDGMKCMTWKNTLVLDLVAKENKKRLEKRME